MNDEIKKCKMALRSTVDGLMRLYQAEAVIKALDELKMDISTERTAVTFRSPLIDNSGVKGEWTTE